MIILLDPKVVMSAVKVFVKPVLMISSNQQVVYEKKGG